MVVVEVVDDDRHDLQPLQHRSSVHDDLDELEVGRLDLRPRCLEGHLVRVLGPSRVHDHDGRTRLGDARCHLPLVGGDTALLGTGEGDVLVRLGALDATRVGHPRGVGHLGLATGDDVRAEPWRGHLVGAQLGAGRAVGVTSSDTDCQRLRGGEAQQHSSDDANGASEHCDALLHEKLLDVDDLSM